MINNYDQNFKHQQMPQHIQSMPVEVSRPERRELLQWGLPGGDEQPLQGSQPQQGCQPPQVQQSPHVYQVQQQLPQFHDYPAAQRYQPYPQDYQQCSAASRESAYIRKAEIDCQKEGLQAEKPL